MKKYLGVLTSSAVRELFSMSITLGYKLHLKAILTKPNEKKLYHVYMG